MKSNTDDYLKYWKVIRQYAKIKYELNQSDLDMLFFLYSEKYFDKDKFAEFNTIFGWDRNRFENLKKRGWIEVFRRRVGTHRTIYQLTTKANKMIMGLYNKLNGEEIPTSNSYNRMFLKNVSYTDKVYRNMIIEMNKVIKQRRHQSPE
jgi:hypothetical protein